jgi:hypothetical protein
MLRLKQFDLMFRTMAAELQQRSFDAQRSLTSRRLAALCVVLR